ncbi:hypothetical protein ACGFIX_24490 [Nocardia salmonicida]|uniref:hypothetical protein n=1 Tax=Nocardia salmonicida TaxID=53431 RepID=UPI003713C732
MSTSNRTDPSNTDPNPRDTCCEAHNLKSSENLYHIHMNHIQRIISEFDQMSENGAFAPERARRNRARRAGEMHDNRHSRRPTSSDARDDGRIDESPNSRKAASAARACR